MGVPARQRLRKQAEFLKVRSEGQRVHCGPFIFQCRSGVGASEGGRRLGVIASRRVGNAVKRNYGKRIFRELFRLHQSKLPEPCELVIVLRSGFDARSFAELEARFVKACEQVDAKAGGQAR